MNYNLKNHSAYYIGTLLERKKIDPIILLEYYLANYKKANTNKNQNKTPKSHSRHKSSYLTKISPNRQKFNFSTGKG